MTKLTDWFDIDKRPRYRGCYQIRRHDGTESMAKFKGKNWFSPDTDEMIEIAELSVWRGLSGLIAEKLVIPRMESMEVNRRRKDVRPLFRHWVSSRNRLKACRYYLIGEQLGAKFSRIEKGAFTKLFQKLSQEESIKVRRSVKRFFGQTM